MSSTPSSSTIVTPSQLIDEILKTEADKPDFQFNRLVVVIDALVAYYDTQLRKRNPSRMTELASTSEPSIFGDERSTKVKLILNEIYQHSGNKRQTIIGVLNAIGNSYWTALPFSELMKTVKNNEWCWLRVFKSISDLSKVILGLQGLTGLKMELQAKLNESIHLVVKGAILCCSQKKRKVVKRLLRAPNDGQELQQLSKDIDDMNRMFLIQISTSALKESVQSNLVVSPPVVTTFNNDTEQVEGVYGIGGSGKTTLAEEATSILEGLPIHTNLSPDDIIYIKSICHESHLIGKGSFARVYKGIFQGKDFAIKKIEHRSNDTKKWMENEVELLQGIEHKNINMLYAWCIEASISYLVYMYISGCSLDEYLRGNCIGFSYSWNQCFKMIVGIAEGIEFLHRNKIIHVDIKPQNIMVDANDNEVKLVDFGFSRKADWEGTHCSTDKIIGTRGYWAPEYCFNHKLSFKQDVFSFGIVVLEMLTGEKHVDNARSSSQFHIPEYVRYMISSDRFEEAVDPRLKQEGWDSVTLTNASSVANIALRCVIPDKAARPFMDSVVRELTSIMMSSSDNITTV